MKQLVATIAIVACHAGVANAQSFTERLQNSSGKQGTVTIKQDAAIDDLVNNLKLGDGSPVVTKAAATAPTTATAGKATAKTSSGAASSERASAGATGIGAKTGDATGQPADDANKKTVRTYKVDGYRVQAFSGGNTRRDRQQAEQIGNEIKEAFPDQAIYVHFYSPRWICRVGNYRTYEEAHQMMLELQKRGYKQALIVKGKITIQY